MKTFLQISRYLFSAVTIILVVAAMSIGVAQKAQAKVVMDPPSGIDWRCSKPVSWTPRPFWKKQAYYAVYSCVREDGNGNLHGLTVAYHVKGALYGGTCHVTSQIKDNNSGNWGDIGFTSFNCATGGRVESYMSWADAGYNKDAFYAEGRLVGDGILGSYINSYSLQYKPVIQK